VHKRTFARAAGVSPPWVGKCASADTSVYSSADRRRCACVCVDGRCNCVYRRHGGLTPPALVLECERLPAKQRFLRCTNVHFQERRASARRGVGKSPRRRRFRLFDRLAPEHVGKPPCHDGSFPTAGSRQPLLLHGAGRLKNNDIRGAQTHVFKSGGRQPAVGVSNAVAIANAFVQRCARQPAVGGQMRIGRQERYSSADRRRCACVCVDGRCNCVYRRHGGLTPPALVVQRPSTGRMTILAMHKRTFDKSGGRQPAVGRQTAPADDRQRFHRVTVTQLRSPRTIEWCATAGSRQPLLLHGAGRLKNNDIRGAQTHVRKSGGRQPAV
jgi:hypothetical protein